MKSGSPTMDHDHAHGYAVEYEYGRRVSNRTSVWRFCQRNDALAFEQVDPLNRVSVTARHKSVKAALGRLARGSTAWEEVRRGIYRIRL